MKLIGDDDIRRILQEAKTIAVVGASAKSYRDSNSIMKFLRTRGYTVVPVNPRYREVLGERCYPSLREIPLPIDIVDIFRRSSGVKPIIDDAIAIGARTVWLQLGVIDDTAAQKAQDAGLNVIMNRCILIEYRSSISHS